jgi:hypothetical protein
VNLTVFNNTRDRTINVNNQIDFLDAVVTDFDNDTAFDNIAYNMDISTPSTVSVPCVQGPNMCMQHKQTMSMSSYTMMNKPAPVIYNYGTVTIAATLN